MPSITLMAQTMRVWPSHSEVPHRRGATCSDVTAGRIGKTNSDLAEILVPPSMNRDQVADTMQVP